MGGRIIVESVAGCWWNGCPDGHGIPKQYLYAQTGRLALKKKPG